MILGMAGYARSGKNTVGDILAERGFEQRAFADKIREALLALNPKISSEGDCYHCRSADAIEHLGDMVEEFGWDELKDFDDTGP